MSNLHQNLDAIQLKVGDPGSRTLALLQPRSGQIGLRFFSLVRTLFVRSTALPAALQHQAHRSHRDLDGVAAHQLCCYMRPYQLVPLGVKRETMSGRLAGQKQLPAGAQPAAKDSGQCICSIMAQGMSALSRMQSEGSDTTTSRFAHACRLNDSRLSPEYGCICRSKTQQTLPTPIDSYFPVSERMARLWNA